MVKSNLLPYEPMMFCVAVYVSSHAFNSDINSYHNVYLDRLNWIQIQSQTLYQSTNFYSAHLIQT